MNRRTRKAAPRYRIYLFAGVGGLLLCMGILSAGAWMASLVDLPRWGMEGILLAALGSAGDGGMVCATACCWGQC